MLARIYGDAYIDRMDTHDPQTILAALVDETRLRLILLLADEGELCVCELTQALRQSQPKVSRHLALLREAGLLKDRRDKVWVHYRVNPELPAWVRDLLAALRAGSLGRSFFHEDRQALHASPLRVPAHFCD